MKGRIRVAEVLDKDMGSAIRLRIDGSVHLLTMPEVHHIISRFNQIKWGLERRARMDADDERS